MRAVDHLVFYDRDLTVDAADFLVEVPANISSSQELLRVVAERAGFPSYFGHNWNALADCLRDLHWVTAKKLLLVHTGLPRLPLADLRIYLEVLIEATMSWRADEEHAVWAAFPNSAKAEIEDILKDG